MCEDAMTTDELFDSKVEVYARSLAAQRGLRPDQLVFLGEPERINISGRGVGFLVPDQDRLMPVWQYFVADVHAALAVMGKLPGQRDD
jgi:hypothetical protein